MHNNDAIWHDVMLLLCSSSRSHIHQMLPKSLRLQAIGSQHGIFRNGGQFLHLKVICTVNVMIFQWRRSVINLGGPGLRPPVSLHQSSFFLSLSWTLQWVWAELLTRCQTFWCNLWIQTELVKSTLMFSVLPGTEIGIISATVGRSDTMDCRTCIGGPCTFGPQMPESGGSGPQDLHRIATTVTLWRNTTTGSFHNLRI